jgi:hypothetical protein
MRTDPVVTTVKKKGLVPWMFSPFAYVAGWRALLFGLAAIFAAGFAGSFSHTHLDGVLDVHSGRPAPLWIFLSEGFIDWLALGIVLLIFGKIISRTRFRSLDLLGTQAMARWPTILTAIAAWPDAVREVGSYILHTFTGSGITATPTPIDVVVYIAFILISILVTCWFVALAYNSFSVSCNVKGGKAIGFFIAGILTAEALSKYALALLLRSLAGAGI